VPDEGETLTELNARRPIPLGQTHVHQDAYGFLWIDETAYPECFATGVDVKEARVLAATQKPFPASIFNNKMTKPAWRTKASWYQVSSNDLMIPPETERFMADRIGAQTISIPTGHTPMLSRPTEVVELIVEATIATVPATKARQATGTRTTESESTF
jgi:pimeloyl-ACP methyl ester carboxylesterase